MPRLLGRLRSSYALLILLLALPGPLPAAGQYVTANFIVYAPNQQVAQKVGEYAERWRRDKALEWLGREMPAWGKKCPLRVTVTPAGSSGETTFAFDNGSILDQEMHVAGSLERILDSVLPHEITHTVFAYRFRQPLPRWADEGGSVLSEDNIERQKHDDLIRRLLVQGNKAYRLRALLTMMRYPNSGEDVLTLYAQGYSVVRFLVESSNRQTFLDFLADGMRPDLGWDKALQKHYRVSSIEQLESAWLNWMRHWFSPQARLHARPANGAADTAIAAGGPANQALAARVPTPGRTAGPSPIEQDTAGMRDRPTSLPRALPADRPWSPIAEPAPAPAPAQAPPPGWRPVRASISGAIPSPD
jgi:hypothetical protein